MSRKRSNNDRIARGPRVTAGPFFVSARLFAQLAVGGFPHERGGVVE